VIVSNSNPPRPRVASLVLVVCTCALILSGCGAQPGGAEGPTSMSLLESKAPVQLMRNEISARIPPVVVENLIDATDASIPCKDLATDPDGLYRAWQSTARFGVVNSRAGILENIVNSVADSFVAQGWSATAAPEGNGVVLTKAVSAAELRLNTVERAEGQEPEIVISTLGPCVLTEGPDSDEVALLERTS